MEKNFKIASSNEEIRNWVESHDGRPAIIDDVETGEDEVGLRINFPGGKDEDLLSDNRDVTRDIDWDKFFAIMDSKGLVFEYLDEESLHNPAMSYRFLDKDNAQIEEQGELSDVS